MTVDNAARERGPFIDSHLRARQAFTSQLFTTLFTPDLQQRHARASNGHRQYIFSAYSDCACQRLTHYNVDKFCPFSHRHCELFYFWMRKIGCSVSACQNGDRRSFHWTGMASSRTGAPATSNLVEPIADEHDATVARTLIQTGLAMRQDCTPAYFLLPRA